MPETVWYKSLYWRIALGFVALTATLLAAQGLVFLWLTGRASELLPGRSPAEFAQTIAADLGTALAEHPDLDIDEHLNTRYSSGYRPFAVVTTDGRTIVSRRVPPPPSAVRAAYGRLMGFPPPPPPDRGDMPGRGREFGGRRGDGFRRPPPAGGWGGSDRGRGWPPPDRPPGWTGERGPGPGPGAGGPGPGPGLGGPGPGPGPGPGRGGGPGLEFAPVQVAGQGTVAMVAVLIEPPPLSVTVRQFGPAFAAIAIGLLIAGTSIAALVIFRPSQRRLRSLQHAARALGTGETGVRATEIGGDEVASLARAFNEMAAGLEDRSRALADSHETRRQLLADVSHELMTPLAAIRGFVETMAMSDVALDEDTKRRYLKIVVDETERLEHIIGDLLDLARVEGGGGTWKHEPVPVAMLFERVSHRHEPVLREKGIVLDAWIAPDVETVIGDSNRLEQALQNLAANAVRHTPPGGHIRLSADRVAAGVRIAVEDSGSGVPEEHLPRVFDRFYKVDVSRTGTALPSGSGLGLSIVHAIVSRHGGTVTASNAPGGGARFEIEFPNSPVLQFSNSPIL